MIKTTDARHTSNVIQLTVQKSNVKPNAGDSVTNSRIKQNKKHTFRIKINTAQYSFITSKHTSELNMYGKISVSNDR
jgi:hypothetical protein